MTRGSTRTATLAGLLFLAGCAISGIDHADPDGTGLDVDDIVGGSDGGQDASDTGSDDDVDTGSNTGGGDVDVDPGTGDGDVDPGTGGDVDAGTGNGDVDAGTGGTDGEPGTDDPSGGGSDSEPKPEPTGMQVGTNFWFLADWGENAFQAGVDFATTNNPWNPTFIADLEEANYAVFRFMDFGGTNHSPIREWSERTQKTSAANATEGGYRGRGIAYEWMFDLCNRLKTDCWITVPHLAIESYEANTSSNYFTELAKLAKASLDPSLNLYIEYSNETWNGGFEQAVYVGERGVSAGYAADSYTAGFKFHVYASTRMYEAFRGVYGKDIDRVKWVVAGQLGSEWGTQQEVEALADRTINPNGYMPAYHAISSYVGHSLDGASGNIVQEFRDALANTVANARAAAKWLDGTGMKLIAYEGGQHITTNADVFSRNPVSYELYTEWLDQTKDLFAVNAHYGHSGSWSAGGAWGAKSYTGEPLSSAPKARAIVEWIAAH